MIQDAPGRNAGKNLVLTKHKFPAKSFFFLFTSKNEQDGKSLVHCT